MLTSLFPSPADNAYRGRKPALWLLGLLAALRLLIGLRSILDTAAVAQGTDGIPLDTFAPAARAEVLVDFALLGLHQLKLAAICVVVLWRYRALVPATFALLVVERAAHWAITTHTAPTATIPGAPGNIVAAVLLAMTLAGLVLSLWRRPDAVNDGGLRL